MTVDQVIAMTASAGTFLAAIATFMTVKEIAKQRVHSYLPVPALPQIQVACVCEPQEVVCDGKLLSTRNSPLASVWSTEGQPAGGARSCWLLIPIVNVGSGPAKDVKIEWKYPIAEVVRPLNDLAQRLLAPFYLRYDDKHGTLSLESQVFNGMTLIWRNTQQERIDYLLPSTTHPQSHQVRLPGAFILLVAAYFHLQFEAGSKSPPAETKFDLHDLELNVSYRDISDRIYQKSFEIAFDFEMFAHGTIHGTLTPREKQAAN